MKSILCTRKSGLLVVGFLAAILVVAGVALVSGQGSYSGSYNATLPATTPAISGATAPVTPSSSAVRSYCVGSGYLYTTTPGVNGGQPICQFSGYSWCDATAFATGKCGANIGAEGFTNPYGIHYPYYLDYSYYAQPSPAQAYDACFSSGGSVTSVHTQYGDTDVCKLPNGNILYIPGMYNELGPDWYYSAYNFLNSP